MVTILSANVNGIRAAARRQGLAWLADLSPDVMCVQEVRASDEQLAKELADAGLGHLHLAHAPASTAGRAGVAILSQTPLRDIQVGTGHDEFVDSGRWVEARTTVPVLGSITVASTYIHTGEADTPRQDEKYRYLECITERMTQLRQRHSSRGGAFVCGDFNVARSELDIKNHRGNRGKAGFLEGERDVLDGWFAQGWNDLARDHAGQVPGPYTWWSWRGKAFDNDAGWRIDYISATDRIAQQCRRVWVGRADSYAERWSDHAPVVAEF